MNKLLQAIKDIIAFIAALRELLAPFIEEEAMKDLIDFAIDMIEKNNVGAHPEVVAACKIVRKFINVPDDDIDDENPI